MHLLISLLLVPLTVQEPQSAFDSWQKEHGSWILHTDSARGAARFLYGGSIEAPWTIGNANDLEALARKAFDDAFGMFRIADSTLIHAGTKHLALAQIGTSDKWVVRFEQVHEGLKVVGGSAHALFGPDGTLIALDSGALPSVEELATRPLNDPFAALKVINVSAAPIVLVKLNDLLVPSN